MKTALSILSLALLLITAAQESRSETVTLFANGNSPQSTSAAYTNSYSLGLLPGTTNPPATLVWVVAVRSNEVCKLVGGSISSASSFAPVGCTIGENGSTAATILLQNSIPSVGLSFVGPGQVGISSTNVNVFYANHFVTFSIARNDDFVGPQNTVAIPADAAGPVTVKMETSTNLVNWVAANPGSYGVSSAMRYFRLRAVRDNP